MTSKLSERTSQCSSVGPATASRHPDSSSANRSRLRPLHSSRPTGGSAMAASSAPAAEEAASRSAAGWRLRQRGWG